MSKFWKFINTPFFLVTYGVLLWAVFLPLVTQHFMYKHKANTLDKAESVLRNIGNPLEAFGKKQNAEIMNVQDVIPLLNVTNIQPSISRYGNNEKYIGSVINTSDKYVSDLEFSVRYYDDKGALIDVDNNAIRFMGAIKPGGTYDFSVDRHITTPGQAQGDVNPVRSSRVDVKIQHLKLLSEQTEE